MFLPRAQGLTKFLDGTMAVTLTGGRLTVKAGPPHPIPDALKKTEPPTTVHQGESTLSESQLLASTSWLTTAIIHVEIIQGTICPIKL